jgi:hypothetical protein
MSSVYGWDAGDLLDDPGQAEAPGAIDHIRDRLTDTLIPEGI